MNRKWAINTSPLIFLGKISCLHLLPEMSSEMIIPAGVAEEILNGPDQDPTKLWLEHSGKPWINSSYYLEPTVASWDLGLGESYVLSWCYQHPDYEAILDDGMARKCASSLTIPVRGTLGILLLAKKEQRIKEITPLLNQLLQVGYRINATVLKTALNSAGE